MEIFTKFVDFLLERHWKTFFISILCGVVALYVIPKDFYNNLPFSNRDINIALCLFAVIIVVLILVLRHEAKKHPKFAKWALWVKISLFLLLLIIGAVQGNGIVLGFIEAAIGVGLIVLIRSFFH